MTYDDLRKNIATWVKNVLAIEVIYASGQGPRPKDQYVTINVTPSEKLIEDVRTETREVGGEIRADYEGVRKIMVSINVYRGEPMQAMITLRNSLSKILTQDYFNSLDIGIIEPNAINRIPEQIGKSWEDRSQCDFFFHYIPDIDSDPDISEIKQIEITNEINGEMINVSDI